MSLMAAAASAADKSHTADTFQVVRTNSGRVMASSEWRKALILRLSRLRCAALSARGCAWGHEPNGERVSGRGGYTAGPTGD